MIYTLLDDVYKDLVTLEVNNYKFLHNGNQKPNWPQINWLKLHNMDFELIFPEVTYITSIKKQSPKKLALLVSENPIKNCKTQAHSFWGWKLFAYKLLQQL